MALFLFLKQLVDMVYQFKILDYILVIYAILLLGYRINTEKTNIQIIKEICTTDYIVGFLGIVYFISFLKYFPAYGTFFKVESGLLLYFLGRVYGKEILKYGKYLAVAGYLVVYSNFFYRFYQFGYKLILDNQERTLLNVGGLYYYKTDLAIGMVVAFFFIYMFSEKKVLKWITIIPVCGYMVYYSGARNGQIVITVEYLLILIYELTKKKKNGVYIHEDTIKRISIILYGCVILFFIALQYFPFEKIVDSLNIQTGAGSWIENLLHSRHIIWWDILTYFSEQPFLIRMFGIDLETEYMHTTKGMPAHSMYIKQIYAAGYIGCILLVTFIVQICKNLCREKNRKLVFIVVMLWAMLLITGLTVESLESTQMSWFPMLFAGVLITSNNNQKKRLETGDE